MSAKERPEVGAWTIEGAETLLRSLAGVVSVRIVAKPGGEVEEIHMLTTEDVSPKQTVRNVESALLAHFDLEVDHRKISVAQSRSRAPAQAAETMPDSSEALLPRAPAVVPTPLGRPTLHALPQSADTRIVFCGHAVQSERSRRVRFVVEVEWKGQRFEGEGSAPDLPRNRLDAAATATLHAVENALQSEDTLRDAPTLALDGVKQVEAFDRRYVLVSVHAIAGRDSTSLAGSAAVEDSPDRAVIMATLQATDRWVRGRV